MATERRPYHRTADSIGDELWSNDVVAFVTRLSALLHTRWRTGRLTGAEACRITLGIPDLLKVSGMRDTRAARTLGARVAECISCVFDASDASLVQIVWPKWAEFQGLSKIEPPENGERPGREWSPSASSARVPRPESIKSADETSAGALKKGDDPESDSRKAARSAWPALQAAAAKHGGTWRSLSASRLKTIAARIADGANEADLVAAIHGAVAGWKRSKDFDWKRYLTPETIFQASKFAKYVEAAALTPLIRPAASPRVETAEDRAAREALDRLREANRLKLLEERKPQPVLGLELRSILGGQR